MAKKEMMFQCELGQGTARQVAYIEEHGAIVGRTVEIIDGDEKSEWEVLSVPDKGVDPKYLKDLELMHRNPFGSILPKKARKESFAPMEGTD